MYCPHCESNLDDLLEFRCPDCGGAFEPEQLRRAPRVPWERRLAQGPARAFGATLRLAVRHPAQLRALSAEPLDKVHAIAFRGVLILWSAGWALPAGAIRLGSFEGGLLSFAAVALGLGLAALAVDAVHWSPWMGPHARTQARALSCYAAAPLLGSPVPAVVLALGGLVPAALPAWIATGLDWLGAIAAGVLLALWMLGVLGDFIFSHPHGRRYAALAGVWLAASWAWAFALATAGALTVHLGWGWWQV